MIGTGELIVILCVIMLLFGGKKLPEFAKNLGKGIREFKKACQGINDDEEDCLPISVEKDEKKPNPPIEKKNINEHE